MGFLKMLRNLNNADGAREAMRLAYLKHYRLAERAGVAAHSTALFGALGSRRKAGGQYRGEPLMWAEVAPFVCMPPELGREALAEYVVCLERPAEGRIGWLREQLNRYLNAPYDTEEAQEAKEIAALSLAQIGGAIPWAQWLSEDAGRALLEVAAAAAESSEE